MLFVVFFKYLNKLYAILPDLFRKLKQNTKAWSFSCIYY